MGFFSTGDLLESRNLFKVTYLEEFIPLMDEAEELQMSYEEVRNYTRVHEVFEHPSLDLSSLFDKTRQVGATLSSTDQDTIQAFLQECKTDIDSIETQISETISTIGKLCRTLSEASCRLVQRKRQVQLGDYLLSSTLAPIQLLPQEVLEEIFLTCFSNVRIEQSNPSASHLKFAAVCHQWRTIALGMPALWKYASFDADLPFSFDRFKLHLERCPFPFVSLNFGWEHMREAVMTQLADPSLRIRALSVIFSCEDEAFKGLSAILKGDNADDLEELVIYNDYQFDNIPAPNLKRLFISKVPTSWTTSPPLPQLTALLVTSSVHWTLLEYIILQCPCLQRVLLSVAGGGPQYLGPKDKITALASPNPYVHSELRWFCLVNDCDEEDLPADFLKCVSFPGITSFEYFNVQHDCESLLWLASHDILPRIRRLTIQISSITPDIFRRLIDPADALEELSISCEEGRFDIVLPLLIDIPSSHPERIVLPRLKALQLGVQSSQANIQESVPLLQQLIHSWSVKEQSHPLSNLNIICWECLDRDVIKLRDSLLQDGGVNLELKFINFSLNSWKFLRVPVLFEMYQTPFDEIRKGKVLGVEGGWKEQYGPSYRLVD